MSSTKNASKIILTEAPRAFMTRDERILKKKLIQLLRDDGKGHHHAKYAERLEDFDINIVPYRQQPDFTAAIAFGEGIIYIGQGFLFDINLFYQLNVLIRHELCHNLLMHQIRMRHHFANLYNEDAAEIFEKSATIHDVLNIIMDDEISNKKYTEEDKNTVRNMVLNGKVIGGLITEDHRKDWAKLSLEDMYNKIVEEMDSIHASLQNGIAKLDILKNKSEDPTKFDTLITGSLLGLYIYADTDSTSEIDTDINDYFKTGDGKDIREDFKELSINIYDELKKLNYTEQQLNSLLEEIAKSNPLKELKILNNKISLYTPEQKLFANQVVKKAIEDITQDKIWYKKIYELLADSEYSKADIQTIIDGINKNEVATSI